MLDFNPYRMETEERLKEDMGGVFAKKRAAAAEKSIPWGRQFTHGTSTIDILFFEFFCLLYIISFHLISTFEQFGIL